MKYKRDPKDCPACNGWFLIVIPPVVRWVKNRETKNSVCQTCGKDYTKKR